MSGGIAALYSHRYYEDRELGSNFKGGMYSFLSLPDVTHLPVHLNGTWAQGSDRGRLLIEDDNLQDLDHQKLNWNRYILLKFLPKLHCDLLKEVVRLQKNGELDSNYIPVSKRWPFPSATRNCPKYAIEYGFEVLQRILEQDNFWSSDDDLYSEASHVESLFELLSRDQVNELRLLLRNNWDGISNYFCFFFAFFTCN